MQIILGNKSRLTKLGFVTSMINSYLIGVENRMTKESDEESLVEINGAVQRRQ